MSKRKPTMTVFLHILDADGLANKQASLIEPEGERRYVVRDGEDRGCDCADYGREGHFEGCENAWHQRDGA